MTTEPRHNLPASISSFVGRHGDLADVQRLLVESRLVTLAGTAGVGKTRLACEAAAAVAASFDDGIWFIELASLADPADVPRAVAAVFDVREQADRPLAATLVETLRQRDLLLIFDNCEHLVGACASLASALVRGCPRVRILATSREPLRLTGEIVWRVAPLSPSDAEALFIARVQSVVRGFQATLDEARAAAHVCRRLDGIPLALELAAARVPGLGVEQLARRLDDCFRLLVGAVFERGYARLTEPEQILLRRCSTFSDGWTLEAAERICAGDGLDQSAVLPLLVDLVDKSHVVLDTQDGQPRYRLLETLRLYTAEKLAEAGEEAMLRQRYQRWFAPPAVLPPGLTPRECEVAALVAHGYTNRAIADELVIAERTAEGHVERIRGKLGFQSRSQVAAWAARSTLMAA